VAADLTPKIVLGMTFLGNHPAVQEPGFSPSQYKRGYYKDDFEYLLLGVQPLKRGYKVSYKTIWMIGFLVLHRKQTPWR